MSISSSSDSDRDEGEDREILNRILAKSGNPPISIPKDLDSDSDGSSESDVQDWFRKLQQKFSVTSSADADSTPMPLNSRVADSDSDDDEDVTEIMAAIHRRFDHYQNDALKEQSQPQEADTAVADITAGTERTDILHENIKLSDQLLDSGFNDSHQSVDESCNLSVKALTYSQFPKSAQNFVDALKKNRSCQRFVRKKLIEIEAKIEENKKLKERIKCLMDFQLACKKKVGHILSQKKDPRVRLISMQKPRKSKTAKPSTKFPALYFGPVENSHVSKYKMVMKRFPVSFKKQLWSNIEKENLAKGLTQQYQEMLLLNSMNLESDSEGSVNPDLVSDMLRNDLEVTPEKIRSFLPLVNWDRLASMYLPGRSGAECESRWLNCEDPLINYRPWTILEDKKLLYIVQERGIYNWIDIAHALGTQRTPFQCLARYQRSLNPHILNKDWTEDEDARLRSAMEIFGESNWQLVASSLEGRTGPQCSNRWRKTLNPDRRKVGRWSVDEDKRLKVAVMLFGAKNWNKIAEFAPGRTQVQCRERWLNCLDPSLKLEAWTDEEDAKLLAAIDEHGYSWSKVATCVPPRTDNQCLRRWKILLPHEVPLLRAARRMKRTVLVSNFVDRESERPAIGPSDFSSLENLSVSECRKSRRTSKKRSREETREDNQREASRDKKVKKSRVSPEENCMEGSGASETGKTKRRKRGPRWPSKSSAQDKVLMNETSNTDSTVDLCACEDEPLKSKCSTKDRTLLKETITTDSRVDVCAAEVLPLKSKSRANDGILVKETSISDSTVDVCADEDVPLKSWLDSLALESRKKRSTKKLSRRPVRIKQKEIRCDNNLAIPTLNPAAKRKRSSRASMKNAGSGRGNVALPRDYNNKSCNLVPKAGLNGQATGGNADADGIRRDVTSREVNDDDTLLSLFLQLKAKAGGCNMVIE